MAELLVKAIDATHADEIKDISGCYKAGDIVIVRPDGWQWGALELKAPADGGKFVVIKITDVTVAQIVAWVRNHWGTEIHGTDTDAAAHSLRRRRVRIDTDLVPLAVRQQLNQTGQFSTTWAAIRQFVRNKTTNAVASGAIGQ